MLTTKIEIIGNEPEKEYAQTVSLEHRKKFAQFFTPFVVAEFMSKWILGNKELKTVLDPAFGLGIFTRAIRQKNADCFIKGFEIDETILQEANAIFKHEKNISVLLKDYMFNDWGNHYDGIICNPPYFKFHDYDNKTVLNEIEENLGLKLNGFTNLYTLFLLKSAYQLNKNGRSAYIIPSEFLNSDYGKLVKSYLIENKLLRYIIVFDFEENVFDDALTTASILLFSNDNEKTEVEFINVKSLNELQFLQTKIQTYPKNKAEKSFSFSELNPEIKWRAYYQKQNATRFKNLVPFSTYGKVMRGIATGANEYFTFNQSKAKQYEIDDKFLLPCITKSIDVNSSFFTKENFEELKRQDKNIFLFNACQPNRQATKQYEALSKYILKGEAEEINKRYLTASRNPWYALEKRPPSPIWVSVFNRNGLRFIRNEANISNLTTFHCIYLNLFSVQKVDLLFAYLLTDISKEIFNDNRREYGNGLNKFEPNDINKSLMVDLDKISKKDEEQILNLYFEYRKTELPGKANANLLEEMNGIFVKLFSNTIN